MSFVRRLNISERVLAVIGSLCVLTAAAAVAANPETLDTAPPGGGGAAGVQTPTPEPGLDPADPPPVLVQTSGTVVIHAAPDPASARISVVGPGIYLPITTHADGWVAVITPCDFEGWIDGAGVTPVEPAPEGRARSLEDATFVLDPGHGGWDPGAVGPTGLTETEINMILVERLVDLLSAPRTIDRETRAVVPGDEFGTPRVLLTRAYNHSASLRYRAAIASAVRADGFVSIHNNAAPDGQTTLPGTETYYQIHNADSKRLAGLIYEEMFHVLRQYNVGWVGDRDAGAKYRPNEEGGDYYGILRRSEAPAVLVEAMFISNPAEEALLRDPAVQQALAESWYRAFVRYIATDDPGSGFVEPYPRGSGAPVRTPPDCVDPA